MNILSDSHNHLHFHEFGKDLKEVIDRAFSSGIKKMLLVGIDPADSEKAVQTALLKENFLVSMGIHPQKAGKYTHADVLSLQKLIGRGKVAAIGETGFDLYRTPESEMAQRELFRSHISLARDLSLPLVIHDRDAHVQTMEVLNEENAWQLGGVFHCYSGDVKMASEILENGFYISIPGVVTFNNASVLREVVRMCPLDKLLVETDAPYLAPIPFRGKRNEPAYLMHTVDRISKIKECSSEDIIRETTLNFDKLFAIKK